VLEKSGESDAGPAVAPVGLLTALADDLDTGFADLVRTYQHVVYSVALRVSGGGPAEAEDLAAEAFLLAYRALRGYDRSRRLALQPRSWLLTILLNTWRNSVRSASRRPAQTLLADPPERRAPGPSVEQQAEAAETRQELAGLLTLLPDGQRTAVVLRHVAGLSIAEIATVMSIPEGTVKSHASRGLHKLRLMYERHRLDVDFAPGRPVGRSVRSAQRGLA
jgi:RNA polymerase sigma factor (sigma-70 family)